MPFLKLAQKPTVFTMRSFIFESSFCIIVTVFYLETFLLSDILTICFVLTVEEQYNPVTLVLYQCHGMLPYFSAG